ncbi:unnamed protein product [Coccothraustes coccothraustes]
MPRKQGACPAPPPAAKPCRSQARREKEPQRPSRRVLAEAGTPLGGAGAATSGEPRSSRGAGGPQIRGLHTHTHTHARTYVRTYVRSTGRGPAASQRVGGSSAGVRAASRRGARPICRPISASGRVPRARGAPRAGSRDSGGGARPAREGAEGERRVPGPGRVRVRVAVAAAGSDTTSAEPGAGRAARRPAPGESVLSRVRALSVALCVASPRRKARGACAVPPPCAAPLARDPGAASRPSGGTASPPVAPRLPAA